jgi:hypothetical protein
VTRQRKYAIKKRVGVYVHHLVTAQNASIAIQTPGAGNISKVVRTANAIKSALLSSHAMFERVSVSVKKALQEERASIVRKVIMDSQNVSHVTAT